MVRIYRSSCRGFLPRMLLLSISVSPLLTAQPPRAEPVAKLQIQTIRTSGELRFVESLPGPTTADGDSTTPFPGHWLIKSQTIVTRSDEHTARSAANPLRPLPIP